MVSQHCDLGPEVRQIIMAVGTWHNTVHLMEARKTKERGRMPELATLFLSSSFIPSRPSACGLPSLPFTEKVPSCISDLSYLCDKISDRNSLIYSYITIPRDIRPPQGAMANGLVHGNRSSELLLSHHVLVDQEAETKSEFSYIHQWLS